MSRDISIALIDPDPQQPRQVFEETALAELAASMTANGLLQAIMVRPFGARYVVVHGERRLRAARSLGWLTIAAEVRDIAAEDAPWLALVENLQRADLSPIEEARAYQALITAGATQMEFGRRLGKGQSAIATKLRLLKLPEPVQGALHAGMLHEGAAKHLLRLDEPSTQAALCQRALAEQWTVHRVRTEVDEVLRPSFRIPTAAIKFTRWLAKGQPCQRDPLPEDRLPEMFQPPIAVQSLRIDAIHMPSWTAWNTHRFFQHLIPWYAAIFETLPPISVYDVDGRYILADGWFRLKAAQQLGHETITCRIYAGTSENEAMTYWYAANAGHGHTWTEAQVRAYEAVYGDEDDWPWKTDDGQLCPRPLTLEDLEYMGNQAIRQGHMPYDEESPTEAQP
jgi:ParB/RepB/Spo0J family partition protein